MHNGIVIELIRKGTSIIDIGIWVATFWNQQSMNFFEVMKLGFFELHKYELQLMFERIFD